MCDVSRQNCPGYLVPAIVEYAGILFESIVRRALVVLQQTMSFGKAEVSLLRAFTEACAVNPQLLHQPELAFFKDWLRTSVHRNSACLYCGQHR